MDRRVAVLIECGLLAVVVIVGIVTTRQPAPAPRPSGPVVAASRAGGVAGATSAIAQGASSAGVGRSAAPTAAPATPTPITTGPPQPSPAPSATSSLPPSEEARVVPDPSLTPGATDPAVTGATIQQTICQPGYVERVRPPAAYTDALKRDQITRYRHADTNPLHYQEDALISLGIGGAPRDPRNWWPERATVRASNGEQAGAHVKDRFEDYLQTQVCAGRLGLIEAQREMATDWFGAWRRAGRP